MTELRSYKVSSLTFENKVENGTQLKLKNQFSYNVNYYEQDKRCVGKLDFRITDDEMKPFSIRIEMEALFTYEDGDEREDIHADSFAQLFPFLRQIVNTATAMSGIPGLVIPLAKIDRNNVKINNTPPTDESTPLN